MKLSIAASAGSCTCKKMIKVSFIIAITDAIHLFSLISEAVEIYVDSSSPYSNNSSKCWEDFSLVCATFDLGLEGLLNKSIQRGQLQHNNELIVLWISPGDYSFTDQHLGHFENASNIAIKGAVDIMYSGTDKLHNSTTHNDENPQSCSSPIPRIQRTVTVTCSQGVGLSFINSSDITIEGISFKHCGRLQFTSSSFVESDKPTHQGFMKIVIAIYFLYCKDIKILHTNVTDTEGTAIGFYNVVGENKIKYCRLERNRFAAVEDDARFPGVLAGGGGIYIEYSYCVYTVGWEECLNATNNNNSTSNVIQSFTERGVFEISHCHFLNNTSDFMNMSSYVYALPKRSHHSAFGSGGGVSVHFTSNAVNNAVQLQCCCFVNNRAVWGGALFIQFQDSVTDNVFNISRSHFINNTATHHSSLYKHETLGGGVRVALFYFTKYSNQYRYHIDKPPLGENSVLFESCVFLNNSASSGGGVSFHSNHYLHQNKLSFIQCTFEENRARQGSAIDFIKTVMGRDLIDAGLATIDLTDCSFIANNPETDGVVGVGAINLVGVNVRIINNINLTNNEGSALALMNAVLQVDGHAVVTFHNNSGRNGGAIALYESSRISVGEYSQLHFTDNAADFFGGAIYYENSNIYAYVYLSDCFIIYKPEDTPPSEWTATFSFLNNTANGRTNSIFSSILPLPCLHNPRFPNDHTIFCNNSWSYNNGEDDCYSHIKVAPLKFNSTSQTSYSVIPGKLPIPLMYSMEISEPEFNFTSAYQHQQLLVKVINKSKNASFFFQSDSSSEYGYVYNRSLYLLGNENSQAELSMETYNSPMPVQKIIKIHFQKCPPGFLFNKASLKCECAGDYNQQIICHECSFKAFIARTSWMGPENETATNNSTSSRDLVVGFTPYVMKASFKEKIQLPETFDLIELNKVLCDKTNRRGTLCGECKKGYGVSVNTMGFDCVPCSEQNIHRNSMLYIASEFIPVTIFFMTVFLFSMRITHGPLNSFVFFSQTVTTVFPIDAHGLTPIQKTVPTYDFLKKVYITPYGFWNLNFFRLLFEGFCISPHYGTLDVLMLGYITALYPLLLILGLMGILQLYNRGLKPVVVLVRPFHHLLARFRRLTNLRQSFTSGIAVFILITYNKLATVSFNLIPFYHLFNAEGARVKTVFYHQGTVQYPQEGILHITAASLVLCTFGLVPPMMLAYSSILKFLEGFKCCKRIRIDLLYPNHKLQVFLEEFHGCYKSGSKKGERDCRWFASLYFALRLFLLLVFSQVNTWPQLYVAQSMIFLCGTLAFAIIRPYNEDWINNLDTVVFAILTAISTLSLYNLQLAMIQDNVSVYAFYSQFVLLMTPLVYCLVYYASGLYSWSKQKCSKNRNKHTTLSRDSECDEQRLMVESSSSNSINQFFDFIKISGRHSRNQREPLIFSDSRANAMNNYDSLN